MLFLKKHSRLGKTGKEGKTSKVVGRQRKARIAIDKLISESLRLELNATRFRRNKEPAFRREIIDASI